MFCAGGGCVSHLAVLCANHAMLRRAVSSHVVQARGVLRVVHAGVRL
jgi:hypothetical protein